MAGARGVVEANVCGKSRRLRLNLKAIDAIELQTEKDFSTLTLEFIGGHTPFGVVLTIFREMCLEGGTPLAEEEEADLLPSDLPEMIDAIEKAWIAVGVIERDAAPSASKKKGQTRARRPGKGGKSSRSES